MLEKLRKKLQRLERLEKVANEADLRYLDDPDNEELELDFNIAYEREYACYMQCVSLIQEVTKGKLSFHEAKKLVTCYRKQIIEYLTAA